MLKECEALLCELFNPKGINIAQANNLRWHLFKQLKADQGGEKLPLTPGAWTEHIQRAHVQESIWCQDFILHLVCPDPLKKTWMV